MRIIRTALTCVGIVVLAACSGGHADPTASVASSTRPGAPSAAAGAPRVHVVFADSSFSAVVCGKPHVLANCFDGTGSATVPGLGLVHLRRSVVSGDQRRSAPAGCDPADTTGTLTDSHGGRATVTGSGSLCGQTATYTLLVDHGTGSLAGLHLTGTIRNDSGAESWDVAGLPG